MNKVGVLGYGEVGRAVASLYKTKPKIKDLEQNGSLKDLDIVHICIPFSKDFEDIVVAFLKQNNPKYCIIHSTVAPQTTENINKKTDNIFNVCHAPVRGIHPNLREGLLTFESYLGSDFDCKEIQKHLSSLGLKIIKVSSDPSNILYFTLFPFKIFFSFF